MDKELRKSFTVLKSKCRTKDQMRAFNEMVKSFVNLETLSNKVEKLAQKFCPNSECDYNDNDQTLILTVHRDDMSKWEEMLTSSKGLSKLPIQLIKETRGNEPWIGTFKYSK